MEERSHIFYTYVDLYPFNYHSIQIINLSNIIDISYPKK